jgi:hypothetical protein
MTPPSKRTWSAIGSANPVGKPTLYERGCHRPIFPHHWLNQRACGKSLLADAGWLDAGRGDLLKTIIAYRLA